MTEIEKIRGYNIRMASCLVYEIEWMNYFVKELHNSSLYSNLFDKEMTARIEKHEQSDSKALSKHQSINHVLKEIEKILKFDKHLREQFGLNKPTH